MRGWTVFAASLFLLGLWFIWFFQIAIMRRMGVPWHIPSVGAWGDTFGALNALFAASAALGVLWTLGLQRRQLDFQRQEIERQQEQIDSAERAVQLERFDTNFFHLLALLREERSQLRFRYSDEYIVAQPSRREVSTKMRRGKMAVRSAMREARFWLNRMQRQGSVSRMDAAEIYETSVHSRFESTLGPYFRIVYTILRRIHTNNHLTPEQRVEYGNLLRSQLTSYEAALVGINGLAAFSNNLHEYVSEYRLLKYVNTSSRRVLGYYYDTFVFEARD